MILVNSKLAITFRTISNRVQLLAIARHLISYVRFFSVAGAISHLQKQAQEVMRQKPKWQSYFQGQMISKDDYDFISNYDQLSADGRVKLLADPNARSQVTITGAATSVPTFTVSLVVCEDLSDADVEIVQTANASISTDTAGRMSSRRLTVLSTHGMHRCVL